jgi:hypothetical protein
MKAMVSLMLVALAAPALAATEPVRLTNDVAKAIVTAKPDEAIVVVVMSHDKWKDAATLVWQRYDVATGALVVASKDDARVPGLLVNYRGNAQSAKMPEDAVYVGPLPAGDYALIGHMTQDGKTNSFCFGAPVMHVEAGTVSYLGSYRKMSSNDGYQESSHKVSVAWEGNLDKAKETLRKAFPALADRLVPATIHNGATFECSGERMWAYRVPGAPDIQAPGQATASPRTP